MHNSERNPPTHLEAGRRKIPARGNTQSRVHRGGFQFDPDEASDLRRKRERALIDTLVERAAYLAPDDRELLTAVYRDNRKLSDLATLIDQPVRRLRARVRRIIRRALDPRFAFVAANREQWPRTRRRVATLRILFGRTLRETARELGLSLHQTRQAENAIHALFEAERDAARDLHQELATGEDRWEAA